jgi:hypothetical protein
MHQKKNDLLDRYLNAIKFWLPRGQQKDIIAEIAEDLHSQIDERETALGHPVSEGDLVGILRQRGSPMKIAASYVSEQRLINPVLLPVYRLVLKIVLLWVLAPLFAIIYLGPIFTSGHPAQALLSFCNEAWRTAFMVVGIVTTVFFWLDRFHAKIKESDNWDPRKLPHIPATRQTTSRWNHLAGFIFGAIAAICWILLISRLWGRMVFSFPGGPTMILAPVWGQVAWPSMAIVLASALTDGFSFLYPARIRARAMCRIAIDGLMVVVATILLGASNWVTLAVPHLSETDLLKTMTWLDGTIRVTLVIIILIALGDAIREGRRLFRARPVAAAAIQT